MDGTHYSISEAGKLVGVESHVLRYWEDELQLKIPRNGKDYRYYTDLHIQLLKKVKELKEKGYQLKAIEQVLRRMLDGEEDVDPDEILRQNAVNILKEGKTGEVMAVEEKKSVKEGGGKQELSALSPEEKMQRFQQLMNHIIGNAVGQAVKENSEAISGEISRQVNDRMVQELEYMMRISDEREEERFKMLDESLRAYQKNGKSKAEAAATRMPFFRKKKFGRSGKKM
ncbi:helix-turn-helix domain-containing protein [Brotaphodocola sp.]|uniref:helix-turn-helix domain-containing protein n=1 Tax=Brotaphodocola sp. TaxID=3073577 RepID=UPI003D7E3C81